MTATNESSVDSVVGMSDIELRVPADARHLPIVRSLAASIAMREDFDLDFVSDLKLAVDEACSMLAGAAWPGADLRCRFRISAGLIEMTAAVVSTSDRPPDVQSFGWRVLTTLADTASARVDPVAGGHRLVIELTKYDRGNES